VHLTSFSALSSDQLLVIIDNACRSSFQYPLDRPDVWHTDWTNFQTHLVAEIPSNPEMHDGIAMDTSFENLSGAVLKALAAFIPKNRPCDDPRPPIPADI
jgi:hypothetical protein